LGGEKRKGKGKQNGGGKKYKKGAGGNLQLEGNKIWLGEDVNRTFLS